MKEIYFQVDDKVTCFIFGKGIVKSVSPDCHYPIAVDFGNNSVRCYTHDGRYTNDKNITLFQGHIEFILPVNKPIHQFKKGDLVWVEEPYTQLWTCRYFSHMRDSQFSCYNNQQKEGVTSLWSKCVPYDQRPF